MPVSQKVQFRLRDQRRFNRITVENEDTGECVTLFAQHLLEHETILQGLDGHDAYLIGYIAGSADGLSDLALLRAK